MGKRLFLIDGTALAYRSYFAFANNPRMSLTTSSGHPTGATYGFVQTLRSLLEREQPDAIAIAFDGPRQDLHRTALYAEYKSTRSKMPEEMALQLGDIRAVADAFGITVVVGDQDEADDVIGTLAVQGKAAGMTVFIVTGDKDFLQIVDGDIQLWNLRSSTAKPEIIGAKETKEKWGVSPQQIVDLLALMGDSSDNVPGVPKVGEKTAVELLQQFGSLDQVLARTAEVKRVAVRTSLEENRHLAVLSRQLVTLRLDVPLPVAAAQIGPSQPDLHKLRELYSRLQFDSLLKSLPSKPLPNDSTRNYQPTTSLDDLSLLVQRLCNTTAIGLSVLTKGAGVRGTELDGLAFSWAPGQARYVQLSDEGQLGSRSAILAALTPLLTDPNLTKAVADSKRALGALRTVGIEGHGFTADPSLAHYCVEPGTGEQDLASLMPRHFGCAKISAKDILSSGKKQMTFSEVTEALATDYACEAADYSLRLWPVVAAQMDEQRVAALYRDLELPLVPVLLSMEWEGIAIDCTALASVGRDMERRIADLEGRVHQRAGAPFNLASPQQVGKVLFDDLEVHRLANLPLPKRTPKGQYRTDHEVLEKLAPHHEVPAMLLEWRQLTKLKGTYVDSLPTMVDKVTGRVHTTLQQTVTATGRLSSDNPNLQNIPIRTDAGKRVRATFVSRGKDWVLMSADYSQIELRILAHLSGDKALVESFRKGEDIHSRTAAIIHGLLPHMVTPDLRNQAKIINYGLMYGMGSSRLAAETGMKPPEAKKFIEHYFRALPGVKQYLDQSIAHARERKEVRTMFDRRRPLPDIDSTNPGLRVAAENMAVNTPIQGTAADIVKRAMLRVHAELLRNRLESKLILQVHDELVLDVKEDELILVRQLVKDAMMGAAELRVPLEVALGTGKDWLQAH
ncbi:MAG: DNA polymerase I [Planctomycetota bacterium]|nr:DNA polymerase I [Planctomycetota bacterium]